MKRLLEILIGGLIIISIIIMLTPRIYYFVEQQNFVQALLAIAEPCIMILVFALVRKVLQHKNPTKSQQWLVIRALLATLPIGIIFEIFKTRIPRSAIQSPFFLYTHMVGALCFLIAFGLALYFKKNNPRQ